MFVKGKRKGLPALSTEEEMNNWKSSQYNTVYAWQDPKKGFIWSKYLGKMFIWSKYLVHSSSSLSPLKLFGELYWLVIIILCVEYCGARAAPVRLFPGEPFPDPHAFRNIIIFKILVNFKYQKQSNFETSINCLNRTIFTINVIHAFLIEFLILIWWH